MKYVRLAGCLAAVFAMSMVAAGTASAAPHWLQCLEGNSGTTRYTASQCKEASASGAWSWSEVTGTEAVIGRATVRLTDSKTPLGAVAVQCSGTEEGTIGPTKFDRVEKVNVEVKNCSVKEGTSACTKLEEVKAVNLPWQTELVATEGKILDLINNVGTAGKEPGWAVKCDTPLGSKTDTCEAEGAGKEEALELENKATGTELLVLGTFEKKQKAKCTEGGAKSGSVEGTVALLKVNGLGLQVSS